jgi:signal transduction histidine kinase
MITDPHTYSGVVVAAVILALVLALTMAIFVHSHLHADNQGSKTINCQLIGDPDQAIKLQLF